MSRASGRQIRRRRRFTARGAREIEELADDAVHLLDVRGHAGLELDVGVRHLQPEPQARERRAQVVRHTREDERAVVLEPPQVARHLVEGPRHGLDLVRAGLLERRGHASAADVGRGADQVAQRPPEAEHDQPRTGQRRDEHEQAPPEPAQGGLSLDALAGQHDPVLVVVDPEADPEGGQPVALDGEPRVRTELAADLLGEQTHAGALERELDELLAGLRRVDPDALLFLEIDEQLAPEIRLGGHEGGAREVDHARNHLRGLARARLALGEAEQLEPRGDRQQDQCGDQDEGAPEKGVREELHHAFVPSGTKT